MSKTTKIDCLTDQSKRPEAIQFFMNIRKRVMRDAMPFTIERVVGDDGVTVTTVTEYKPGYFDKPEPVVAPVEVPVENNPEPVDESPVDEKPVVETKKPSRGKK